MTLTYIFHSGFAIETSRAVLVFDYWMDPAHCMPAWLGVAKQMYVFSSHFHEDHFTREIFTWREKKEAITYILSKDICKHRRARKEEAEVWLAKGGYWEDDNVKVWATGSNDSGVSWVVETEGKRLFHAGDLNNWYARFLTEDYESGTIMSQEFGEVNPEQDEKRYFGELKDIAKIATYFDLVMFPIDGRIGNGYTRGGRQWLERFHVGLFVPMHFTASGFESAWRIKEYCDEKGVAFWAIAHEGESTEIL